MMVAHMQSTIIKNNAHELTASLSASFHISDVIQDSEALCSGVCTKSITPTDHLLLSLALG